MSVQLPRCLRALVRAGAFTLLCAAAVVFVLARPSAAQEAPVVPIPQIEAPTADAGAPQADGAAGADAAAAPDDKASINVDVGNAAEKPSQSVLIILGLT